MAKILLINPVVREEDEPRHIPYGIALLAAIAVKRGHEVQIYDANAWRKGDEILEQACAADDWDVIGIGGLAPTYGDIKKKKPQFDVGCVGEAFVSFPALLDAVDAGVKDFSGINGLAYRGAGGEQ